VGAYDALERYLLTEARRCVRPPVGILRHPWIAPMPASARTVAPDDGFASGDYSGGLFHHDASEAAIELLRHEELRDAAAGSLLCLLDAQRPDGLVPRTLLTHKVRDKQPSRPVIAQFALRCAEALGDEWAVRHRVLPRAAASVRWWELECVGGHGLFTTWSSLASGFDNDVLTAGLPDRSVEGPDTNAAMVREYDALAALSRRLGEDPGPWEERAAALRARIDTLLWFEDDRGGFYVGLRWIRGAGALYQEVVGARGPEGGMHPVESWLCLLPLWAGVPTKDRAALLVERLVRRDGYWGPKGIRTVPAWSPYFHQGPRVLHFDFEKGERGPVSNWCGPVWVLANAYLCQALQRYDFSGFAADLAKSTADLLAADLEATGCLHESYADDGRGLWPQAGTFISWNVLAVGLIRDFLSGEPA
jgi:putative isomerase